MDLRLPPLNAVIPPALPPIETVIQNTLWSRSPSVLQQQQQQQQQLVLQTPCQQQLPSHQTYQQPIFQQPIFQSPQRQLQQQPVFQTPQDLQNTPVIQAKPPRTRYLPITARQTIRDLFFIGGLTRQQIQDRFQVSRHQVKGSLARLKPRPRTGRPSLLAAEDLAELETFVTASKKRRFMTLLEVSETFQEGRFSEQVITRGLRRLSFSRRVALRKPFIDERTRQKRLEFALRYQHWGFEQWANILWSDETWVNKTSHRKRYVTRRSGEALHEDCIREDNGKKKSIGWMFWGSFSAATGKGPGLFWEKEWGPINKKSYRQRILPHVERWILQSRLHDGEELLFMQDNAPGHAARETVAALEEMGIQKIDWPPNSPDLNPIETVWNWMKDWIQDVYGDVEKHSKELLRHAVQQAWEAVPEEWLRELVASMPLRIEEVIRNNGKHTKF